MTEEEPFVVLMMQGEMTKDHNVSCDLERLDDYCIFLGQLGGV